MRINCAICLEVYTASDEISSTLCGHIFHTSCGVKWFKSNKQTCPTCRKMCPERDFRRLYPCEAESHDLSQGDGADTNKLHNQIDSLKFNLRMTETEKKKSDEQRDALEAKNCALRQEYRSLESRCQQYKDQICTLNDKIKILSSNKRKFDQLQHELEETKRCLELYKTIETAVNGSSEELNRKLHEIGDYSQASKDLNLICMALKKELKNKNEYEASLLRDLNQRSRKTADLKATIKAQSEEINQLKSTNQSLSSEIKSLEDELSSAKLNVQRLQEAVVSPSNDAKSSAINRLLSEHPQPMNLTLLQDKTERSRVLKKAPLPDFFEASDDESKPPLSKKTKSYSIPCKEVTNRPQKIAKSSSSGLTGLLGTLASQDYRCESRNPGKTDGLVFDGLGGHSKLDSFPQPLKKDFKLKPLPFTKKPKGVSRPKTSFKSQSSSQKIDKFFVLDTP